MDCSKYIERAKNNKTGSVNWTLQLEKVQELVKEFKKVHPKVKYTIEQDWDDDLDYTVTFSWEPGTFGAQEVVQVKAVQEVVQEVVKKDVKVRYK